MNTGQQDQKSSSIIGTIFKSMAGLASVTGVISAILSAMGFLILRSNANLLGLSASLHHSIGDYLYVGVRFLISTLGTLISHIISLYWLIIIIGAFILVVRHLLKRTVFRNISERLKPMQIFQKLWIQWICITLSAFIFILFIYYALIPFTDAQNLLFASGDNPEIIKRTDCKSLKSLEFSYISSVYYMILSVVILLGISRMNRKPRIRLLPVVLHPFSTGRLFLYLIFIVELVIIPINYGRSIYPNNFHKVSKLVLDERLQMEIPEEPRELWFLQDRSDSFIFYLRDRDPSIIFISKGKILSMSIKEQKNILVRETAPLKQVPQIQIEKGR